MKRRSFVKHAGHGLALGSVAHLGLQPAHAATVQRETISLFTHGSNVTIEFPENAEFIQHSGFGTVIGLLPVGGCWIHAAVPTPFDLSGPGPRLASVRVRFFTSSPDIVVDRIDVYDGEILIQSQERLALAGGQDFSFAIDPIHSLSFGLGVSLHVAAGPDAVSHEIRFFSAGGTFLSTL